LKYRNARRVAPRLAAELAGLVTHRPDLVTWVPAAPVNRRRRGYDQSEVLARRVAHRLGVPAMRLLARRGGAQTSATREERLTGPILAVRRAVRGAVLVVDDVVTSGASLATAAAGLRSAGAGRVDAVVVAARPEWTFGISK
jgi:predicted amidophosphoribosyltransferase